MQARPTQSPRPQAALPGWTDGLSRPTRHVDRKWSGHPRLALPSAGEG